MKTCGSKKSNEKKAVANVGSADKTQTAIIMPASASGSQALISGAGFSFARAI